MYGFSVQINRCPDGVELVTLPAIHGAGIASSRPELTVFSYRTDRRESDVLEFVDLENPVVIDFANATDDERRLGFFDRFGLTVPEPWVVYEQVLQNQMALLKWLQIAGGKDLAAAMAAVNNAFAGSRGLNLRPSMRLAGPRSSPHIHLRAPSLLIYMFLEMATAVALGARVAACEKCGRVFLTGPLTGRRSHAQYCSDRCRVAAMRARNREHA